MHKTFKTPIDTVVARFPDFTEFTFESADQTRNYTQSDLEQIVKICNEDVVYSWLFSDLFNGRAYSMNDAEFFIHKAQTEWEENKGFVFFIRDEDKKIVAAIDIKSPDLEEAEIGYWASAQYPGLMTNAVKKLAQLAKEAGYKKLWATTKTDNQKSMNVLLRAGFADLGEIERNGKPRRKFEIAL